MMTAIQNMDAHLGGGSRMFLRVMGKVYSRMLTMQKKCTLMVAGICKTNETNSVSIFSYGF
jgi:hypothetical protein